VYFRVIVRLWFIDELTQLNNDNNVFFRAALQQNLTLFAPMILLFSSLSLESCFETICFV